MNKKTQNQIRLMPGRKSMLVVALAAIAFSCNKPPADTHALRDFKQVNLVANTSEYHPVTIDPTLLNGFGIAWSPGGVAWVNSVGGHVSELYTSEGAIVRSPIKIPSSSDTVSGLPTGIVFGGGMGFNMPSGSSTFLFTGFDGVLSGWNSASGNNAQKLRNPGGAYTGLAIASNNGHKFIYGANFGANRIDVWDTAFSKIKMSFTDPAIPTGYSPYNIQAVGDFLFIMYAQLTLEGGTVGHVAGTGKGFVSVFNTDGSFVKRFASRGSLNIPWGVTATPPDFFEAHDIKISGENSSTGYVADNPEKNDLKHSVILVGNFGDGRINVYNPDGQFLGQLQSHNQTITIDGLWALSFAPSTATSIDPHRLYFSAGPDNESDGLFGYLIKQ